MELQQVLQAELDRRRSGNKRYSLRAFARDLEVDHSTLSQLLRGKRPITAALVLQLGPRLRLPAVSLAEACVQADARAVLRLVHQPHFRTHSRWIAERSGLAMDRVNIALHWLLRNGQLIMLGPDHWTIQPTPHAQPHRPLADRIAGPRAHQHLLS